MYSLVELERKINLYLGELGTLVPTGKNRYSLLYKSTTGKVLAQVDLYCSDVDGWVVGGTTHIFAHTMSSLPQ